MENASRPWSSTSPVLAENSPRPRLRILQPKISCLPFSTRKSSLRGSEVGKLEISASDWLRPAQTPIRGNTVCLYLSGGTLDELKTLFEGLSDGAEVTDPLKEQFFGTYGALNDKFGVRWMFQTRQEVLGEPHHDEPNDIG